jgi:glutamate-1-semialdehyde 2,1-aminomutase
VLAKALGSGFPISLVAGREPAMRAAVDGPVYHLGTYNGHAPAVAAAIATLEELERRAPELYDELERRSRMLAEGIRKAAAAHGLPLVPMRVGSVIQLLWDPVLPVRSYADAWQADSSRVAELAYHLLGVGIHVLERGLLFVSAEHGDGEIEETIVAVDAALGRMDGDA